MLKINSMFSFNFICLSLDLYTTCKASSYLPWFRCLSSAGLVCVQFIWTDYTFFFVSSFFVYDILFFKSLPLLSTFVNKFSHIPWNLTILYLCCRSCISSVDQALRLKLIYLRVHVKPKVMWFFAEFSSSGIPIC